MSKEYGINRNSILNELSYFNVCDGSLLPDVMHDILEGVLQYEVKLLLHVMVDNECFTLEHFNSRLQNVELGYMECKNRPTLIATSTFNSDGNSLKQNGLFFLCTYTVCMSVNTNILYLQLLRCGCWHVFCHCSLEIVLMRMINIGIYTCN